jgi:exodeoxyribonuclease VII large subunit
LRLDNLTQQLNRAWKRTLDSRREKLLPLVRTLNAVSPLATLDRGYAIVSLEGGVILRNAADAKPGAIIEARLARGRVRAKVEGAS